MRIKNSGIEWIGEIPKDWNIQKVKNAFYRKKYKAKQDNPTILSLTSKGIRIRDISNNEGQVAISYYDYNPVEKGDLLLNPMDLVTNAFSSVSHLDGVISPAYINLKNYDGYFNKYYDYYFKLQYWGLSFFAHGKGVSFENRWTLNNQSLMNYPIPVPSYIEQQRITDFLDRKCEKIDSTIEKEQKIIDKLKVYKQSIITEVVTKGLNNTLSLKKTRYFWVGLIPEKWKVGQLKYFATIRCGVTLGKKYPPETQLVEYPYLRVANVQGGYTDLSDIATILITEDEAKKYQLQVGEVLMTEGGDRDKLGRGCIWYGEISNCLHQNHIFAVKTEANKLNAKYFDYITTSNVARNYFDFTAKKTTNLASTNSTTILEFRFPIPPINEQNDIVKYLDSKCTAIDNATEQKRKIIEKLISYKKSLIYEAVTGKINCL